jgi:hypothetical protein
MSDAVLRAKLSQFQGRLEACSVAFRSADLVSDQTSFRCARESNLAFFPPLLPPAYPLTQHAQRTRRNPQPQQRAASAIWHLSWATSDRSTDKEISIEENDRRHAASTVEGKDVEAILQNRVLNNSSVKRAGTYHKEDCKLMASSVPRFELSEEQVRELLDALLAAQREVEGTNTVTGAAPKSVDIEGAFVSPRGCTLTPRRHLLLFRRQDP